MKLTISVITICFNCENEIKKTIESVLAQDYKNVEYIIIDGGSRDKTLEFAKEYEDRFAKKGYSYIISSEPDNGIYDAMNKGIGKCSGHIIGILNAGDWYEPNALRVVANTYYKTRFDMFYADINLVKPNGKVIVKHSKQDIFPTSRHWNHPTSFVTKKLYSELGAYRCKGIHDDFEFLLRVKKAKKNIVIRNIVLANFVTGGVSNAKSIKKSITRLKDRYWAYRVNGYGRVFILECILMEIFKAVLG